MVSHQIHHWLFVKWHEADLQVYFKTVYKGMVIPNICHQAKFSIYLKPWDEFV